MPARSRIPRQLPQLRAECLPGGSNAQRPCPYVSCKHHLALDVKTYAGGSIAIDRVGEGFNDFGEIPEDRPTCALDLADDKSSCSEIAALLELPSSAHVHMIVKRALRKLPEDVARFLASRA